jgi:hypothetical protein
MAGVFPCMRKVFSLNGVHDFSVDFTPRRKSLCIFS